MFFLQMQYQDVHLLYEYPKYSDRMKCNPVPESFQRTVHIPRLRELSESAVFHDKVLHKPHDNLAQLGIFLIFPCRIRTVYCTAST